MYLVALHYISVDMGKLTPISKAMLQCSKIIIAVLGECLGGFIYRRKIAAAVTVQGDET